MHRIVFAIDEIHTGRHFLLAFFPMNRIDGVDGVCGLYITGMRSTLVYIEHMHDGGQVYNVLMEPGKVSLLCSCFIEII